MGEKNIFDLDLAGPMGAEPAEGFVPWRERSFGQKLTSPETLAGLRAMAAADVTNMPMSTAIGRAFSGASQAMSDDLMRRRTADRERQLAMAKMRMAQAKLMMDVQKEAREAKHEQWQQGFEEKKLRAEQGRFARYELKEVDGVGVMFDKVTGQTVPMDNNGREMTSTNMEDLLKINKGFWDRTKEFENITYNVKNVLDAAFTGNPNGIDDNILVRTFMLALEPGSVVREGEFDQVKRAPGAADSYRGMVNQFLRGEGELTSAARAALVQGISQMYERRREQYSDALDQARTYAEARGVDLKYLPKPMVPFAELIKGMQPSASIGPELTNLWRSYQDRKEVTGLNAPDPSKAPPQASAPAPSATVQVAPAAPGAVASPPTPEDLQAQRDPDTRAIEAAIAGLPNARQTAQVSANDLRKASPKRREQLIGDYKRQLQSKELSDQARGLLLLIKEQYGNFYGDWP